ncbi:Leucine rich repeat protein, partial [Spraguea lophii 42_110]
MNFLLFVFLILITCTNYKITSNDYDSLRDLIIYSDDVYLNEVYNEISNNSTFLCSFTLYKFLENYKKIKVTNLINEGIETGYNKLPKIFCEISNLKHLALMNLNLYKLPSRFENLKDLKILNLVKNEFQEFPRVLFSLTQLKMLHIDINKINMIPSEIIKMTDLETLSISRSYNLKNINVNLCKLKNLKQLDLSFNRLLFSNENFIDYSMHPDSHLNTNNSYYDGNCSVYENIETFPCLKNLQIHNNTLSLFPSYFQNIPNLEKLDISTNDFEEIPHEIYSFLNLKKLEIDHNRIKIIIIDDNIFTNMLELCIQNNEIQQFSISDNALQNLISLNLSTNKIYKLDSNILKLKQLEHLIMSNNILTEIGKYHYTKDNPIYLSLNLKNISVLANIFYYNGIEKLIITCLEQFDGDIHIFENVPTNSKIEYLDLSYCFLTEIPYGISKLINLKIFIANHNQIVELKNVFGSNSSLKLLELIHNQLNNVDESIFDMPALQELILYGNRIELLPARINNISNRRILIDLCRNPLLRQVDTDIQTPELITIDQVDQNILRNIRYTRLIIPNEFIIPGDIN